MINTIFKTIFDLSQSSYWLLLLWLFSAGVMLNMLPKRTEVINGTGHERWYWISALLLVLPYIFFAAYRENFMDTGGYALNFRNASSSLSDALAIFTSDTKDAGYYALVVLVKALGVPSYEIYFLLVAGFQMICILSVFRKYSPNLWASIFLFIASADYISWMFNGIRQFLAVTMIFAATDWLLSRKYVRYLCVVLVASTIHQSALLMLPFALIMLGPAMNRKTLMMIAGCVLFLPLADRFLPVFQDILSDTQYDDIMSNGIWENDDGTNIIRVLVYSTPALLALFGRRYVQLEHAPVYNLCINASLISMALYLVSSVTSGIYIGRVPIYVSLYGYILLPWLIDQIFEKTSAKLVYLVMIVLYFMYFYYQMQLVWGLLS